MPVIDRGGFDRLLRIASSLVLYAGFSGGVACADTPATHDLPMHAIVGSRNLQPRDDQLRAFGYSDLAAQEAAEVDSLYRKLMQEETVRWPEDHDPRRRHGE